MKKLNIRKAIMYFAYQHLNLNMQIKLFKLLNYNQPCGYGEIYSVSVQKAFDKYLNEDEKQDKDLLESLKNDMIYCWCKFKALPYEYFLYDFRHKNDKERDEYETDIDRVLSLRKTVNNKVFLNEINNKYNLYCKAKSFFAREAIVVSSEADRNTFMQFVQAHPHIFCKPLKSSEGRGALSVDIDSQQTACQLFAQLIEQPGGYIIEEKIVQVDEMAFWNPTSVNTIRIPTFYRNNTFTVIWTRMRMGQKGSVVDNVAAGGFVVNVDPATGIVVSDGVDENYNRFEIHPDLHVRFKDWQVPRWNELLETVEKLHRQLFPNHVYVAWDFALTEKGWVLVEGNWGKLLGYQLASKVGVKKEFHELIGV
jgi:hypothetical protein